MKIKTTLIAALLAPSFAMAQYQDRSTGQQFDAYGRPLPSVEELCREGQMAGGPITPQCGMYDYRFNRKGERLARYDFAKWGYNVLDNGVTVSDAARLDSDPTFRAKYIKSHGYDKHEVKDEPPARIDPFPRDRSDEACHSEADLAYQVAQASAKGIPIETVRTSMAKALDDQHVSTPVYNDHILLVNRAYAWQKHGYTLEQIRDADFQACKGTPILEVPELAPTASH